MPFDIPAGATEELEFTMEVLREGEFESQAHLYLDDIWLVEKILTVKGTAK